MRRCALTLSLLVLGLGILGRSRPSVADEADVRRETQLKSGYLLNFVKFVEWPPTSPDAPLTLCFLGAAGMRETLEGGIGNKRVGSRPLVVREIRDSGETEGCNALY